MSANETVKIVIELINQLDIDLSKNQIQLKKEKKIEEQIKLGKYPSLYRWLQTSELSHSYKIKSGLILENLLSDLIKKDYLNKPKIELLNINYAGQSKHRQVDIIFKINDIIYYRECKGNVVLDSEKYWAVHEKIQDITEDLQIKYPNCIIDFAIVNFAQLSSNLSRSGIKIEGFNEFIEIIGCNKISVEFHAFIGEYLGHEIKEAIKKENIKL